jgi:hypothetical protein
MKPVSVGAVDVESAGGVAACPLAVAAVHNPSATSTVPKLTAGQTGRAPGDVDFRRTRSIASRRVIADECLKERPSKRGEAEGQPRMTPIRPG